MRIAMFGGSFNPIHNGHIEIVRSVKEKFALDLVLLMVANDPPHKLIADGVPAALRLQMTMEAAEGLEGIEASDMELRREGKSYTVETLDELRAAYPQAELYCIVGADMLLTINTWYKAEKLLKKARFIAVGRPDAGGIAQAAKTLSKDYGADITLAGIIGPDISSTMIRKAVEEGCSIEGLTAEPVIRFIYQNCLYLDDELDAVCLKLRQTLAPHRFEHTMGVVRAAAQLACRYGVDTKKARLAALLHDCAKVDIARQRELAREYAVDISALPGPVIHGPVGAALARQRYGVQDEDVLCAIARHTICTKDMSGLDKVVYLADKIEYGRKYDGVEEIRRAAAEGLNEGMAVCLEHALKHLNDKGEQAHPATREALEEIKIHLKEDKK